MKVKLFSICFLLSCCVCTKAQLKLGVQAGVNLSSSNFQASNLKKYNYSPKFGLVTEFKVGGNFLFRPGLSFSQFKSKTLTQTLVSTLSVVTDSISKMNRIELPLEFTFPINLGPGKLLIGVAPAASLFFNAKYTTINTVTTGGVAGNIISVSEKSDKIAFGNAINELKNLGLGAKVMLGYQLDNGLELNFDVNLGATNISNRTTANYKLIPQSISANIIYYFLQPLQNRKK
jgi:Outer membrane protein beta-barrel domain